MQVGLNYLGVERTTTEAEVRSVADIHLISMPYSHSVGTALGGFDTSTKYATRHNAPWTVRRQ